MTYNADNKHKRCVICDFCKETDGGPGRSFVWDNVENGWNCSHCQKEVSRTIEDTNPEASPAYWQKPTERRPTDSEFFHRELPLEDLPEAVDPLQAHLNDYLEVDEVNSDS